MAAATTSPPPDPDTCDESPRPEPAVDSDVVEIPNPEELKPPVVQRPPPFDPQAPVYYLSCSPTCGATYDVFRRVLLQEACWCLTDDVLSPPDLDIAKRLTHVNLLLGDRQQVDAIVKQGRDFISRFGRPHIGPTDLGLLCPKDVVLVNHYSGTRELSLKSNMVRHLRAHFKKPWEVTPLTFILRRGSTTDQRDQFVAAFKSHLERGERLWIVKASRMNKGNGIRVMKDAAGVLQHIESHEEAGDWVVQKYIERPLLIKERKFDIRTWILLDPHLQIWIWEQAMLRMASDPYDPRNLDNLVSHLTNLTIQEKAAHYSEVQKDNVMSFEEFQAYLEECQLPYNFFEQGLPRIKSLVHECLRAIKSYIVPSSCHNDVKALLCFQVLGFDFMIDQDFHLTLIEVNGDPWVKEIYRPELIHDLLSLVVHPIYRTPDWSAEPHRFQYIATLSRQ
eukprot:GGOE01044310.1.p1 GENE.GGOE01044310.1~~GGOE01044310.1.p1  ORF type:complete len:449 (-),score=111.72 GGOE01044310.1:78-1424(-)